MVEHVKTFTRPTVSKRAATFAKKTSHPSTGTRKHWDSEVMGPEHPNVATSLNNLAALYDIRQCAGLETLRAEGRGCATNRLSE